MFALLHQGNVFPLRHGEALAGRSAYCRLIINNALTSRRHCVFKLTAEGLFITDLESVNGTFVNGRRIRGTQPLGPGDQVRIGTDIFEVVRSRTNSRPGCRALVQTCPEPFWADIPDIPTETGIDEVQAFEALAKSAEHAPEASRTLREIETALRSVLDRARLTQPLTPAEASRLRAAIARLSEGDAWRQSAIIAIDAVTLRP